jgi:hypothetical protein
VANKSNNATISLIQPKPTLATTGTSVSASTKSHGFQPMAGNSPAATAIQMPNRNTSVSSTGSSRFTRPPLPPGQLTNGAIVNQGGGGVRQNFPPPPPPSASSRLGTGGGGPTRLGAPPFHQGSEWRGGGGGNVVSNKNAAAVAPASQSMFHKKPPPPPSAFTAVYHSVSGNGSRATGTSSTDGPNMGPADHQRNNFGAAKPSDPRTTVTAPRFSNGGNFPTPQTPQHRPPTVGAPSPVRFNHGQVLPKAVNSSPSARSVPVNPFSSSTTPQSVQRNNNAANFSSPEQRNVYCVSYTVFTWLVEFLIHITYRYIALLVFISVTYTNDRNCRPDRPSVPTPRRYGTQYGGAPSPGQQPPKVMMFYV